MIADLKPYPAMKDSSVPWIAELPSHWRQSRGKTLFIESGLPVCVGDEIVTCFRDGQVTLRRNRRATGFMIALKEAGYQGVRNGQLVIHAMDAFAGAIGVSDSDGKCTPEYIVCNPRVPGTSPGYFARALRLAAESGFIEVACQAVRERAPRLRYPNFGAMLLPRPSPEEQAAIVRYLDHVDRRVRRLVRAKRKLIALLTEQKQAIIHHAVTRGLDPNVPLKDSGVEWLGDVPEHWDVKRLRFLVAGKLKYGANEVAEHTRPDWPRYLRITDFGNSGELRADTFRSLPPDIAAGYLVEAGDILFARSGATVGKAYIVPANERAACHAGYLIRARPRCSMVEPEFLFLFTQSGGFEQWKDSTFNIATIQNIGADKYSDLPVPLPPLREQRGIITFAQIATAKITSAVKRAGREIDLLVEYRTRLVADVVTGKLDVREAAAALPKVDPFDTEDDVDDALDHDSDDDLDSSPEEAEA